MSRPMLYTLMRLIAGAALVIAARPAPATMPVDGEPRTRVEVAGAARTYSVHVPPGRPPAGGFPLVLAFHGGGMQGAAMRRLTRLDRMADARGFIVVYPDGVDKHWNDGRSTIRNPQDDIAFVKVMLDRLRQDHPVDQNRVYATGISNGGLFAERVGCELADRVAAIAPVAASMPAELAPRCQPSRPVAVMHLNGTDDPIMPFDGGAVKDFGGRGEGGQVLSVARSVEFWARANGCRGAGPMVALPSVAPLDRTRILRTDHTGCSSAVIQYTVEGGGHTWPGGPPFARPIMVGKVSRQADASRLVADFFLSRPTVRRAS